MALSFSPLYWIYHDSYKFTETTSIPYAIDESSSSSSEQEKKNTNAFYQKGHCHLFLPNFDMTKKTNTLAYSGTQQYSFEIQDVWGPNSDEPLQNRSYHLLGKPIWYFYIEEYWRRMYIQPWDQQDNTCKLPHNQSYIYDKYTITEYLTNTCFEIDKTITYHEYTDDQIDDMQEQDLLNLKFEQYYKKRKREEARKIWASYYMAQKIQGYDNPYLTYYDNKGIKQEIEPFSSQTTDKQILEFIRVKRYGKSGNSFFTLQNNYKSWLGGITDTNEKRREWASKNMTAKISKTIDGETVQIDNEWLIYYDSNGDKHTFAPYTETTTDYEINNFIYIERYNSCETLKENFENFYKTNVSKYSGYVKEQKVRKEFINMHDISKSIDQYKQDVNGFVYIPQKKTNGHIGIKWDASKPCHSLGPFRQGGQFYFFNTVVNRAMPCEYWLDEQKRIRQYYIKQKDKEHQFDTSGGQTWTFADDNTHFIWVELFFYESQKYLKKDYEEDIYYIWTYSYCTSRKRNMGNGVVFAGMNAKRLKDDKYVFQANEQGIMTWYGNNDKVVHNQYEINESSSSSSSSSSDENSYTPIHWQKREWTGWYEKDEIIKCAYDGKWYKRNWYPAMYRQFVFEQTQPKLANITNWKSYWSRKKRQSFPNPSPWLCNSNESSSSSAYSSSSSNDEPFNPYDFIVNKNPFDNYEDNRIHQLHYEYCYYFSLIPQDTRYHNYVLHYQEKKYDEEKKTDVFTDYYVESKNYTAYQQIKFYQNKIFAENDTFAINWGAAIELYLHNNNKTKIQNIEEQNEVFIQFLNSLPQSFKDIDINDYQDSSSSSNNEVSNDSNEDAPYTFKMIYTPNIYNDKDIYIVNEKILDDKQINIDGTYSDENGNKHPLPQPIYGVSYQRNYVKYPDTSFSDYEYLTGLTFNQFCQVWRPLSKEELQKLNIDGDYPSRNNVPYPVGEPMSSSSETEIYENDECWKNDSANVNALRPFFYNESDFNSYKESNKSLKTQLFNQYQQNKNNEQMPSLLFSQFFPILDSDMRKKNIERYNLKFPPPPYTLSQKDEGQFIDIYAPFDAYRNGTVNPYTVRKKYFDKLEYYTLPQNTTVNGSFQFQDLSQDSHVPYDCQPSYESSSSSSESIKTYKGLTNNNLPSPPFYIHPREMSYQIEDGARHCYPDDKFISPIIEYQKVIQLNYERLPQKQSQQENITNNWLTDKICQWGDGYTMTVSIPFKKNNEIQSPFSKNKITSPPGVYYHEFEKKMGEENKLRYKIQFYDNLQKIFKYDFIGYIEIIHSFQIIFENKNIDMTDERYKTAIDWSDPQKPKKAQSVSGWRASYYQEIFNNTYDEIKNGRRKSVYINEPKTQKEIDQNNALKAIIKEHFKQFDESNYPQMSLTWYDLIESYFIKLCSGEEKIVGKDCHFINHPIVRDYDCFGNEIIITMGTEEEPINRFVTMSDGTVLWRQDTLSHLPPMSATTLYETIDYQFSNPSQIDEKIYLENTLPYQYKDGTTVKSYGYIRQTVKNGENVKQFMKGGNVVNFEDVKSKFGKDDGLWVQQCLGAIVKPQIKLILEDNLGGRWIEWVTGTTTAKADNTLKGADYNG